MNIPVMDAAGAGPEKRRWRGPLALFRAWRHRRWLERRSAARQQALAAFEALSPSDHIIAALALISRADLSYLGLEAIAHTAARYATAKADRYSRRVRLIALSEALGADQLLSAIDELISEPHALRMISNRAGQRADEIERESHEH